MKPLHEFTQQEILYFAMKLFNSGERKCDSIQSKHTESLLSHRSLTKFSKP